jgi:hypothetical protein
VPDSLGLPKPRYLDAPRKPHFSLFST